MGSMTLIYRLNPDGSIEYYFGSPTSQNLSKKGSWETNKDTLVLLIEKPGGNGFVKKFPVGKINNAYSGKPSIVFTWQELLTVALREKSITAANIGNPLRCSP